MSAREGEVQAALLAYLGQRGDCFFWRQNVGATQMANGTWIKFGLKGCADILGVLAPNGQFLAVECKRAKGGALSPEQERFGRRVREAGGVYVVARSPAELAARLPTPTLKLPPEHRRVIPR